jgi:uncharacterized protein YbcI
MTDVQSSPPARHTVPTADISNAIVRIYSELFGRGPTRARTMWRDELIVTVVEEIFTKAERTLIDAGHFEQVRSNRMAFQDQVEPLMRQAVESATNRPVKAFMSQVSRDDLAAEVFILGSAD